MTIRIALVGAAALVLSAGSADAQGQPQKRVVISKAVLKAMVTNKRKSKAPLGAKAGLVRRKSSVVSKPESFPATSVREIPTKH